MCHAPPADLFFAQKLLLYSPNCIIKVNQIGTNILDQYLVMWRGIEMATLIQLFKDAHIMALYVFT